MNNKNTFPTTKQKETDVFILAKFKDNEFELDVSVSPLRQTIWLTQDEIALLFGKSRSTITEHINNIFSEGELAEMTSVGNSDRTNHRPAKLYNLDVVLAVGYRVKSERGILFRRWANEVLKSYLLKGYIVSTNRTLVTNENYINLINEVNSLKNDVAEIKMFLNSKFTNSFICYQGNYYDGFSFVNTLICSATNRVIIIDGYADRNVLDFFIGSKKGIKKTILCQKAERIHADVLERFVKQYGEITIVEDKSYHDRFLIIDDEIYILGTSLNSLGNKTSTITKTNEYKIDDIYKDI